MDSKTLLSGYRLTIVNGNLCIVLLEDTWLKLVELIGEGTYFAQDNQEFVPPTNNFQPWGFGKVCKPVVDAERVVTLSFPLKKSSGAIGVNHVAITLQILTHALNCRLTQVERGLFEITTCLRIDVGMAPFSIVVQPRGHQLIVANRGLLLAKTEEIQKAIASTYNSATSAASFFSRMELHWARFGITEENRMGLETLGSCACVGVNGTEDVAEGSYWMTSHNVDSVFQQLSLLAGFAKVSDILFEQL